MDFLLLKVFKSALDVQGHSLKGHRSSLTVKLRSGKVFHGAVLETDRVPHPGAAAQPTQLSASRSAGLGGLCHGSVTATEAPCASALLSEGAAGAL